MVSADQNSQVFKIFILDRVTDTFIYNASGPMVAKTQITYDDPNALIHTATNAIGHDAAFLRSSGGGMI